jgi:hypothetical protein
MIIRLAFGFCRFRFGGFDFLLYFRLRFRFRLWLTFGLGFCAGFLLASGLRSVRAQPWSRFRRFWLIGNYRLHLILCNQRTGCRFIVSQRCCRFFSADFSGGAGSIISSGSSVSGKGRF